MAAKRKGWRGEYFFNYRRQKIFKLYFREAWLQETEAVFPQVEHPALSSDIDRQVEIFEREK